MKTHINIRTVDLARSVDYYKTLLGVEPAKHYSDYALFLADDPGLELALDRAQSVTLSESAHYGIAVESEAAVERAIARLQAAGLATDIERGEICCYAKQSKVWSSDPDGRRWEIYTVLEETERPDQSRPCCSGADAHVACC